MSSSPRLLLSKCSCTCGARPSSLSAIQAGPSSRKSLTTTTAIRSASTSTTSPSHRLQPRQRWLMPNFQARKRGADLPPPKAQKFENKLNLPDGRVSSIYTTSPRPKIAITKDTTNHPLWAFTSAGRDIGGMQQEDEGGRMGRFARKFGAANNNTASTTESGSKGADQGASSTTATASKTAETQPAAQQASKEQTVTKGKDAKDTPSASATATNDDTDFFDLALEGEEVEVTGHKVVDETGGKKGKKAAGKKK